MPIPDRTLLERLIRRELPQRLITAATAPLPWLPLGALRHLGSRVGDAMCRWDRRHRATALANLARVFPAMGHDERLSIARGSFRTLGQGAVETVALVRRGRGRIERRVRICGIEHLEAAREDGNGALLFSAHLGYWEIGGLALGAASGPLHVVARRSRSPYLDRHVRRLREGFGNFSIASAGAARAVLKVLSQGGSVALLIDQRPSRNGLRIPFLGQPSRVSSTLARFSIRSGAPAVPFFTTATPGGYRVDLLPPIVAGAEGRDGAARLTLRYTQVIERWILEHPEAWLWMHRRWRPDDLEPERTADRTSDSPSKAAGPRPGYARGEPVAVPLDAGPEWAR